MADQDDRDRLAEAFHFPVPEGPSREPIHDDEVTEFFRAQILDLLDVVVLTADGEPVRVDGFAFHRDIDEVFRL